MQWKRFGRDRYRSRRDDGEKGAMKTSTRAEDQRAREGRGGVIDARLPALLVALVLSGSGIARAQDTVYYVHTDAIGSVRMAV